jgi:hypothetical protein
MAFASCRERRGKCVAEAGFKRETEMNERLNLNPTAVIVQQGKLLDFIDGLTQRNETPEEYVRQEIAKSLVREYQYAKAEAPKRKIATNPPARPPGRGWKTPLALLPLAMT